MRERLGKLIYEEATAAGTDLGPAAWVFGQDGRKRTTTLWSGTNWSLNIPAILPPWPIVLQGMSVQIYDGTVLPGYPMTGYWFEFGILLDHTNYLPIHAGYSDDAGRLRWTGRMHSDLGLILVFGNNPIAAADNAVVRLQASYLSEVKP